MTHSPDERGIDVALLFSPFSFGLITSYAMRVDPPHGLRPTRDILYASGRTITGDTLHVFVVHAPSRAQGEAVTSRYRLKVAERVVEAVDSIRQFSHDAAIIVAGDFNDYARNASMKALRNGRLHSMSEGAKGQHGACGTYRYKGDWRSLDHILVSAPLQAACASCHIYDAPYLLEPDEKYGGKRPARMFLGPRYKGGTSDHLPLVARFRMPLRSQQ